MAMCSNCYAESFYDARNGLVGDTPLGTWSRRWTYWVEQGAVSRSKDTRSVDVPFVRHEEVNSYASRLAADVGLCY